MKREIMETRLKYLKDLVSEYEGLSYNDEDIRWFIVNNEDKTINTKINVLYNGRCWNNYALRKLSIFNDKK